MEKARVPIAVTLRGATSLSEIAEKLDISRPTLYKYMDHFDNGEYERIPKNICAYFDRMSRGDASEEESAIYLMAEQRRRDGIRNADAVSVDGEIENRKKAIIAGSFRGVPNLNWTDDRIQSLCVPIQGGACVFLKDAVYHSNAAVLVSIVVSGEPTLIGRFHIGPEIGFVNIRDLPKGPEYEYRVELFEGMDRILSRAHPLIIG